MEALVESLCRALGLPAEAVGATLREPEEAQRRWRAEVLGPVPVLGPRVVPVLLAPWGDPLAVDAFVEACRRRAGVAAGVAWIVSPVADDDAVALSPALVVRHPSLAVRYTYLAPVAYTTATPGGRQLHERAERAVLDARLRAVWLPGPPVERHLAGWVCPAPGRLWEVLGFAAWLLDGVRLRFASRSERRVAVDGRWYVLVAREPEPGRAVEVFAYAEGVYLARRRRGALVPTVADSVLYACATLQRSGRATVEDVQGRADPALLDAVLGELEAWLAAGGAATVVWDVPAEEGTPETEAVLRARGYRASGARWLRSLGGDGR